jgi:hypothetical protein
MAAEAGGGHDAPLSVWIAVGLIIGGCIMAGVALIEWVWIIFWIGAALMVIGVVWAAFGGIMNYVSEFGPTTTAPEIEQ